MRGKKKIDFRKIIKSPHSHKSYKANNIETINENSNKLKSINVMNSGAT